MDPFLETYWHDVHSRLLNKISDMIADQLPDDLVVSIEQSITLGEGSGYPKRADIDVTGWGDTSSWEEDWNPAYEQSETDEGAVSIAEPIHITDIDLPQRHLEIRSLLSGNAVVTLIEILSPANKRKNQSGFEYIIKRRGYLESRMNFVEIDLIRTGGAMHTTGKILSPAPPYFVFVRRFGLNPEIYAIQYDDRLPRFRIPLRPKDAPAIVDLQEAIDESYRAGQYWKKINYQKNRLLPKPDGELKELIGDLISA